MKLTNFTIDNNRAMLFMFQLNVYEYSTDMKGASIEVLGIEKGNGTTLTRVHNKTLLSNSQVSVRNQGIRLLGKLNL